MYLCPCSKQGGESRKTGQISQPECGQYLRALPVISQLFNRISQSRQETCCACGQEICEGTHLSR